MRRAWLALALLVTSCDRAPEARPSGAASASVSAIAISASAATNGGTVMTRVLEAGREPRAQTTFAFVPGRAEKAVLELQSKMTRGDSTLGEERVTVRLDVRYSAKDKLEMTVTFAETTARDIQQISSTIGARLTQSFYPTGEMELPAFTPPAGADAHAAEYVKGALVQVASNLLPLVPKEPVGEGARWEHDALRYELLGRRGDLLTVERRSGRHGPTHLATGETVYVSEEQTYRIEAKPDGIARHVEALLVADQPTGAKLITRLNFDVMAEK